MRPARAFSHDPRSLEGRETPFSFLIAIVPYYKRSGGNYKQYLVNRDCKMRVFMVS